MFLSAPITYGYIYALNCQCDGFCATLGCYITEEIQIMGHSYTTFALKKNSASWMKPMINEFP